MLGQLSLALGVLAVSLAIGMVGTNLHALWDVGLIEHWPGGEKALRAAIESERSVLDASFAPGNWADESCRLVSTEGFYPSRHKLGEDYAQRWDPALVKQMAAAARRLAAVLNESLGKQLDAVLASCPAKAAAQ